MQEADSVIKNTCPGEVDQIIDYVRRNPNQKIGIITPFANQRTLITDELKREKLHGVSCGTVHAFQGDEKDVILFSLGISDSTRSQTNEWLKNKRELINVATSRARDAIVLKWQFLLLLRFLWDELQRATHQVPFHFSASRHRDTY